VIESVRDRDDDAQVRLEDARGEIAGFIDDLLKQVGDQHKQ